MVRTNLCWFLFEILSFRLITIFFNFMISIVQTVLHYRETKTLNNLENG